MFTGYQGNFNPTYPATIANGAQESSTIACGGFVLCGLLIPAAFTGTTITFEASVDGINFFPLFSATTGAAVSYTVAQGNFYAIDPTDFYGIPYLQIKSGSAEAAARTLVATLRGF